MAEATQKLEAKSSSESELLDTLIHLAAGVERATALHAYRFPATQAYDTLVRQRLAELREKPIPGTQTLGEFMQRRLSPVIATVEGWSIAAISYYVISFLLYTPKAMKTACLALNPELAVGLAIPVVMFSVWKATQRVHAKLHSRQER